jgi:acetoacetyl-CoA reductase
MAKRNVVVTGGMGGLGESICTKMADAGYQVIATYSPGNKKAVDWLATMNGRGYKFRAYECDVADFDSCARALKTIEAENGPVDVLVNNAGYAVWKPLEETASAEWDCTFAVNVRAATCLSAGVLPGMQARRFGRIINIGSEAGMAIVPGLAAYCVSKHALVALTEVIQDGNHDNGIKAWVICPGFVDTDMGYVVPGANPASFLTVDEVVDMARYLLHTGDNVKLGPQILLRTMRNPMAG